MPPGTRGQCRQHIETELVAFAAHQIGNTWLADAQLPSRFGLCSALVHDGFADACHQFGTHRQNRRLLWRKTKVGKKLPLLSVLSRLSGFLSM